MSTRSILAACRGDHRIPHLWSSLAGWKFLVTLILMLWAVWPASRCHAQSLNALRQSADLLFEDGFDRAHTVRGSDAPDNGWETNSKRRAKGQQQVFIDNGELRIVTAPGADHPAVMSRQLETAFQNGLVTIRFNMEKGESFALDLNDPECPSVHSGHIVNVALDQKKIVIKDSKTGVMNLDNRARKSAHPDDPDLESLLDSKMKSLTYSSDLGHWHELGVLVNGEKLTVFIDDQPIGEFVSAGISHETKRKISLSARRSPLIDSITVMSLD